MATATFIRNLREGFQGDAALYRLDPPMTYSVYDEEAEGSVEKTTEVVVVSATIATFSGPETYIFPADEDGKVLNWGELDGSYRGGLDHDEALKGAGYEVRKEES